MTHRNLIPKGYEYSVNSFLDENGFLVSSFVDAIIGINSLLHSMQVYLLSNFYSVVESHNYGWHLPHGSNPIPTISDLDRYTSSRLWAAMVGTLAHDE